jgi:hypothetical protein
VGRLSYDVTERKLRREFEEYGPIKSIRLVHDKNSGGWISEISMLAKGEGCEFGEYGPIKSICLVHDKSLDGGLGDGWGGSCVHAPAHVQGLSLLLHACCTSILTYALLFPWGYAFIVLYAFIVV